MSLILEYNHITGMIEAILPSKSRIAFGKDSGTFLWAFLNAWEIAQHRPGMRGWLVGEKELRRMKKEFFVTGGVVIKPLSSPPPGLQLEDLGL